MANKAIDDLLKYGASILPLPAMNSASQDGYTISLTASGVNASGGASITASNFYLLMGRQNSTPGFYANTGWYVDITLPRSGFIRDMTIYNGNYPGNNENDVTNVNVKVQSAAVTVGNYVPSGTGTTTNFTINDTHLTSTIRLTFTGTPFYACLAGFKMDILYT